MSDALCRGTEEMALAWRERVFVKPRHPSRTRPNDALIVNPEWVKAARSVVGRLDWALEPVPIILKRKEIGLELADARDAYGNK